MRSAEWKKKIPHSTLRIPHSDMDPKLLKIGGWGAITYATFTAFFYAYLYWRWPVVGRTEAEAVLKAVGQNIALWQAFWWTGIFVSFALIPTFPALCHALAKDQPAYAYIAIFFALIAIILGTLSPIRHAVITPTLAELYNKTADEGVKQTLVLLYKAQEAYGQGLFCVYGST
jgi:hypothetical protein